MDLAHGDFGAKNILLDETKTEIVAVFDFGSATLFDSAMAYALASRIHQKMIEMMMNHYSIIRE